MNDNLDDLINGAFAEFDAAERDAFLPVPGAAAVRRTVAHQRRVRYTVLGALGALLVAVPVAAFAANPRGNNSPPAGGGSAGPGVSASPSEPASPSPSSTPVGPVDVRSATITIPAFPEAEQACPAGTRKFVDGAFSYDSQRRLVIGELQPIMANVDGVPGDEELTTIRCQTGASTNPTQLLALKVGPDGQLTALGYVVNSPDVRNVTATFSRDAITVDAGVVSVTVYGGYQSNGWPPCDRQVRGYAYRNGAFTQVSGPTAFVKPPNNLHNVDFQNSGFLVGFSNPDGSGGSVYCVPMVNGGGEADVYPGNDRSRTPVHYTFSVSQPSFVESTLGEVAFTVVTYRSPTGAAGQLLESFETGDYPVGFEVLGTGTDGITGIDKVDLSGDLVRVSLTASGGSQVRLYRPSPGGGAWQRVS